MNASPAETAASESTASPRPKTPSGQGLAGIREWFGRHPRLAILVIAALAVTISSYPVIFCGKSYVSPVSAPSLVFHGNPFLPGLAKVKQVSSRHDSDTGAMMWWGVPMGFVESRSLLDHGEIPLWNRHGHGGEPLLAQAVSMLGDPLQLMVILGRGSAMAWDLKFLLAKLLFCAGFGFLVRRLLASQGLALIYTALGAWCGAYIFIYNHPVFFVLAYAPWILLSALELLARPLADGFKWGLVWLAANVSCFNAGHVEVAVVLMGGLNLAALTSSLASGSGVRDGTRMLACLGVGTLLILGFTAPVWLTFLAALPQSFTIHGAVRVTQLKPADCLGMFDDCFYHYLPNYKDIAAPGTSLLVLTGVLFSIVRGRQLRHERFFLINTGACVFWAGCVFGLVPASLIAVIPLLNRVGHVQTDFSYLLVIHLTLQSAYGFKSLLKPESFRQAAGAFFAVSTAMEIMPIMYYLGTSATQFHLKYVIPCLVGAVGAPLLFKGLQSRNGRVGVAGWIGVVLLAFIPICRFGLYGFGDDDYLLLLGPRAVLNATNPKLEELKSGAEPFRVAGMGMILAGNYAAVYGLEDIRSCAPLSNAKYIELVRNFPGMSMDPGLWIIRLQDPDQARPLLNLLNVKYFLAVPDTLPPGYGESATNQIDDFWVLENQQAWPRAFFASQIVPVSSFAEFTNHLLLNGDHPFITLDREQADRDPDLRRMENATSADIVPAEHYQLLPNSTAFDIHATSAGVVCLTEGQADDFFARANGQSVNVLTVNRAFKGIYLAQPGNYHVEFRYRPHFWSLSLILFWASAGIVLVLAAIVYMRVRQKTRAVTAPAT